MNTKTPIQYLKHYLVMLSGRLGKYTELNLNGKAGGKHVYGSYYEYTKPVEADFLRIFNYYTGKGRSLGLSFYYEKEIEPYIRVSTVSEKDKSDLTYSVPIPLEVFKSMLKNLLAQNPDTQNQELVELMVNTFITGDVESEMSELMAEKLEKTKDYREKIQAKFDEICQPSLDMTAKYGDSAADARKACQAKVLERLHQTEEHAETSRLRKLLREAEEKEKAKKQEIEVELGFDKFYAELKEDCNHANDMVEKCLALMIEGYQDLAADQKHIVKVIMVNKLKELNAATIRMTGYRVRDDDWRVASVLRDNEIIGWSIQPEE